MNHKTHLYLMVAFAVAAILVIVTGNGAGWVLYALLGACAVMMIFMMSGMGGMSGGRRRDGMNTERREGATEDNPRNAEHDHRR
jgi:hypothetical protein